MILKSIIVKSKTDKSITNSKTNTSNKNKINLNENIQKHNKVLVSEVKDDNNNNIHNSVKSRLLCKMLYNVLPFLLIKIDVFS